MSKEEPKEKAESLMRKFKTAVAEEMSGNDECLNYTAKQCAFAAVELMQHEYDALNERPEALNRFVHRPEFWKQVKKELFNMP